jgi:hypothetical protein
MPIALRMLRAFVILLGKLVGDEEYAYEALGEREGV